MDEPVGALDVENNEKLMDLARKLNIELNQAFIIATHGILVARECSRVYALGDGKIISVYKRLKRVRSSLL
ncbi:MAG: hypothetical protein LM582_04480 [Desulfurococcaceae archaeon]|jgi:ABC-type lipoprotein export system ATPase subunit|nr:hypothetical protein [Desulfurococcaceae archaeon]MCC6057776.1 hypothetical protein [Desulfurococcaceae archaeon]